MNKSENILKYIQLIEGISCQTLHEEDKLKIQLRLKKKPKVSKIVNLLHTLYKLATSSCPDTFLSCGQIMNLDSTVKSTKDALHILHEITAFAKDKNQVMLKVSLTGSGSMNHMVVDAKIKIDGEILGINFENKIELTDAISLVSKMLSDFNVGKIVDSTIPLTKLDLLFNTGKNSKIYQIYMEIDGSGCAKESGHNSSTA